MMKTKIFAALISLVFLGMFVGETSCSADDIKSRMLGRVGTINELKAKGLVGENNKGYLEFRGAKEKADVVAAENNDRKTVYSQIAKKQGVALGVVESHRAAQLEKLAKPGEWLQKSSGEWYKK